MKRARFFHAGCGVCDRAARVASALDPTRYRVEVVHLGAEPRRLSEARAAGVNSVPALVIEGQEPLHLDYGASLGDLSCWWDWRREGPLSR